MENIINQLYQLLASLFCGFLLACLYEIYRFWTVFCRLGKGLLLLTDFLWWLLAFALIFVLWLNYVPGEIRLLFFVGQGLGFWLGRFYCARFLRRSLAALEQNLRNIKKRAPVLFTFFLAVGKIIIWPFILLARLCDFIVHLLLQIIRIPWKFWRWLKRIGRKLVKRKKK
ncbi:MAG: spore cortex biosynthesis protein YabQ [Clostridiales bacterium]|jgi:hypothetical protein|nr:spore cortex biosynthesis protein YabQ [Clostridiales bacterium]